MFSSNVVAMIILYKISLTCSLNLILWFIPFGFLFSTARCLEVQHTTDFSNDSPVMSEESPVLLDESSSFAHAQPEFRNIEVTQNIEHQSETPSPLDQGVVSGQTTDSLPSETVVAKNGSIEEFTHVNNTLNETISEKNTTEAKYRCVLKELVEGEQPTLQIVNSSSLLRALGPVPNVTTGECALVVFYSPWCIFCAKAAPQFNALPRLFPHFSVYALDVITYSDLNMRYGLVAIPTLLLFYNGKAVAKYNESEPAIPKIVTFIQRYTGITAEGNLSVTEEECIGPLSSTPAESRDYILVLSWLVIIACSCGWFLQSSLCDKMVEGLRNTWREAEAQHEHVE